MPKAPHLVSHYLEYLHADLLELHQTVLEDFVKGQNGVYALYHGEKLYYVGLATNLRNRLKTHLKDRHAGKWDHFSVYLTTDSDHLKDLESLLLRVLFPSGNKQKGKFQGATNAKRAVERRFDELKATEKSKMFSLASKTKLKEQIGKNAGSEAIVTGAIRAFYKSQVIKGRLRKDGSVQVGGKVFTSLSAAASAITKHPTNGRWFWHVKAASGEWTRIKYL